MKVKEVMTDHVTWVGPDTKVLEIARHMRDEDIGSVPIADGDRLVGMVTDRDIVVRAVADGGSVDATTARQVMSSHVLYCFDDQPVGEVLKNMGDMQVRRLPVMNRGKRLVGIVSLGDLSKASEKQAGPALREIAEPAETHRATA